MKAPFFWRDSSKSAEAIALALAPFSAIYALGKSLHRALSQETRLSVPVLCVGNLEVGGAGKTPTALYLAKKLQETGERPHILSRGYGGRGRGILRVQADRHKSADVGDEPLLLAAQAPTWTGAKRRRSAEMAIKEGASLLIMDDGFQNPSLYKDISILVADAEAGIGNGRLIPAGPLRESLKDGFARASLLLLLGEGKAGEALVKRAEKRAIPVYRGKLAPSATDAEKLRSERVLAFAGLARPEKFTKTLQEIKAQIADWQPFPDHHLYREKDAAALLRRAEEKNLRLITTEKDMARLKSSPQRSARGELASRAEALRVSLAIEGEAEFLETIRRGISAARREA